MSTHTALTAPLVPRPIEEKRPTRSLATTRDQQLTRKQALAIEYYLQGKSKKKAAELAGYSPFTSEIASTQVFQHPAVIKEIRRRLDEIFEHEKLDSKWIVRRAFQLANANILDFVEIQEDGTFRVDLRNVNRNNSVAIKSLSYNPDGLPTIELVDQNRGIELLARIYKLLVNDKPLNQGDDETNRPVTIESLDKIVREYRNRKQLTLNQQINISVRQPEDGVERPQTIEAEPSI